MRHTSHAITIAASVGTLYLSLSAASTSWFSFSCQVELAVDLVAAALGWKCPEPLARREHFLNAKSMSIEWIREKSLADHRSCGQKTSGNFTLSPFTSIYGRPLLLFNVLGESLRKTLAYHEKSDTPSVAACSI